METAPWRGEKKEGGHGCYSNEIRREKTAIAGTNRSKTFQLRNYGARIMRMEHAVRDCPSVRPPCVEHDRSQF